ncbi:YjjG family noncanonical pyrimidine nucleotidase [Flammeovirga aprica]|uniref:Noncanonical pyrimidine nucleotidase, YjjG family n=1 Tax=Flammeovirga aprica JL-4 TaxID=694437 RepID=A0A7X9RZX2_9BACT|nr:YjjG family noncanonical pyrimidine nucleotidase [Flammeovirga aprica]NME71694.1 noncanonical pyrimidine nucleotidase, YjjG family [Flammeovirga aprica JL-4]
MNKEQIKHIFFDLDHTLWDFEKNSEETLIALFEKYEIGKLGTSVEEYLVAYKTTNHELWALYNFDKVTKEDIRLRRFPMVFEKLGIDVKHCPPNIGDEYLEICPTKPHLMEGTIPLLEALKEKYTLHIITNGFDKTQAIKLSSTGLGKYFEVVVTSESCGAKKPFPAIFQYALDQAGASKEESVMIGDNPVTDIKGAKDFGLKTIYFGNGESEADVEVRKLNEILNHL